MKPQLASAFGFGAAFPPPAPMTKTREERAQIAQTILAQLGGRKFTAMTGAKNLLSLDSGLSFRLPAGFARNGVNYCKITLTDADDYTVEFGVVRGLKYRQVNETTGVYFDMLPGLFRDMTGLEISMGSMGRATV